ncbi:MAG: FkbM family methyltransferase [Afipia sp.]
MSAIQQTKGFVKEAFPSLWLKWHFMRRPKSAEIELGFLKQVVPADATTIDVGANCGLYTRELARLSRSVHAFEPSHDMATLLRQTSAPNVAIHELALSDRNGEAALIVPQGDGGPVHGLASIEPQAELLARPCVTTSVPTARLDTVMQQDVGFVKIDVEGHELSVLQGAAGLIERCEPVFLVEAEDRHRENATDSLFSFFADRYYEGFFIDDGDVLSVEEFAADVFQDVEALLPNGGRKSGRSYVNNFFFFPRDRDGYAALAGAI